MSKSLLKSDKFKRVRGGDSRLLNISCAKCSEHITYYQKDGPGMLKRMYLDRIHPLTGFENYPNTKLNQIPKLTCPKCRELVGVPIVYDKEKRLAYRVFAGAVAKKIVKAQSVQ